MEDGRIGNQGPKKMKNIWKLKCGYYEEVK